MEETPKKIVRSDLVCFLCACRLNKDKVRVFGKSAVDIPGLIKSAIDINAAVFSSSDLFVCTSCYKKLIRFEKTASNLRDLQWELKENYEKGGLRTKRLRKDSTSQEDGTNSIEQSLVMTGAFPSSSSAAKSLKFPTTCTSSFSQESVKASEFSFKYLPSSASTVPDINPRGQGQICARAFEIG